MPAVSNQRFQRLLSAGRNAIPIIQRKCESCSKREEALAPIQTKLTINQPGDVYEREAEHMADAVMRMPDPSTAGAPVAMREGAAPARVQRACACGRTCDDCQKQAPVIQRATAASSSAVATAPPIVHEVLRSPGQPMDSATRSFMEPRFGADFSGVRLHTDAKAAESARSVNALAYTVANHLVFGRGRFAPRTESGRTLIAHELTHVIQQKAGGLPKGAVSGAKPPADSRAAESAKEIGALAYTAANHVVFGAGQYAPKSRTGLQLITRELTHVVQQQSAPERNGLQRACGKAEIEKMPTSVCPVAVVAGGRPTGRRFKFNEGCDTFAPDEEAKLKKFLKGVPSTSDLEVLGRASSDGDAGFNEQLACARANAALAVIKDEHLDGNVKLFGGVGAVPGTFGNAEFRAVAIKEKKGGPPIPSSEPDLKNVFLVTGDKPNVIVTDPDDPADKGKVGKITLDKHLVALGTADIPGGDDCSKFTLGFFQICRPFDTQRTIYEASSTDLEDDRSAQIRSREPAMDVLHVGDTWAYKSVANCADPGVLRSTQVFFSDKPSTGFVFPPAGMFIKGLAWHDFFFTVFSVQRPDGTFHHLKSFYWDIHYCESFSRPTGSDKLGKSISKKSDVRIGDVMDGAPSEPGLSLVGKPATTTCNQIVKGTNPNIKTGSFNIADSC